MGMNRAYAAYHTTSIQTASSERLLILLYDGLITALERAKLAIADQNIAESHKQLIKAQEILSEGLLGPLDMQYEVSKSLASLYEYFVRRLFEANFKKQVEPIDEVLAHARELREVWVQVIAETKSLQSSGPQTYAE